MERCGYVLLDVKEPAKLRGELGHESGVSVADDLSGDAEPGHEVAEVEGCDAFAGDVGGAGEELCCLRASLIDHREDGIKAVRLRQVRDQVHGDGLEGTLGWVHW